MWISRRTTNGRAVAVAAVLAALAVLGGPARRAAAAEPGSGEVSVYFTVEQGDKLVSGLPQGAFRLFEDGRPRPFRLAEPETPVSIVLLIEYSQSSWLYFNDIERAVEGFMDTAPEGNWYALATYSHGVTIHVDFTKRKGELLNAYQQLGQPMWIDTNLYDAVYEILDKMGRLSGRRVLILISSGYDSFSSHGFPDVRKKVEECNVTVFGVGLGSLLRGQYDAYLSDATRMDLRAAEAFMNMLANKSGGQAWFPRFESAFEDVMRGIMQTLQHQYRLVYTPGIRPDGKFHKIRLEVVPEAVTGRKVKVRVREGWRFLE